MICRTLRVNSFCFIAVLQFILMSCSVQHKIGKQANNAMLSQQPFSMAHVGIAVYDAGSNKFLYQHNAEKLFIPASNTKLFACYAAMKYLGDSLPAAMYSIENNKLTVQATGDPTFLHPDFTRQPLFELMKQSRFTSIGLYSRFESNPLGKGWMWDDFNADFMAERDPFPIYGDLATFTYKDDTLTTVPPHLAVIGKPIQGQNWEVARNLGGHYFTIKNGTGSTTPVKNATLSMEAGSFAAGWLQDTLHKEVIAENEPIEIGKSKVLYSQPTDSLLKIMMHRSDNFFAEQILLMVSNKKLGVMDDAKIIDTLLKEDFKALPQQPKWVDGSGLSRYNLFSPKDFIWLLTTIKNDMGMDRIKAILPGGYTGTLKGLYENYTDRIFAKTGTLSNNVALSGYLLTRHNKTLIFSVLINNHLSSATSIRKGIETFITQLIEKY